MARRIEQEDLTAQHRRGAAVHQPPSPTRLRACARGAHTRRRRHAPAKAAIEQLLINSRLAALGQRPICQDTGVVQVFLRVGVGVQFEPPRRRGAAAACSRWSTRPCGAPTPIRSNPLRASMVGDPLGQRRNTRDNTPAIVCSRDRRRRRARGAGRGQGRRWRRQGALRDAEPERQCRRLGARQLPGMGAGGARRVSRRRHRRQPGAGDAARQALAVRADRHRRVARRGPERVPRTRCGSNCTRASTRSASARRALAG